MKLTFVLLLTGMLQVSLASNGQNITLSVKKAPIEKIFKAIAAQTGYQFLYTSQMLADATDIDLKLNHATLSDALDICLKGQPLTYKLDNKIVVIQRKKISLTTLTLPEQQQMAISGTVTSEDNKPMPGVSVMVKGTKTGTQTDIDGKYSIRVTDANVTLVFTSIGFVSTEIAAGGKTTLNVQLKGAPQSLNDVVVIGYGQQRKGDVTSSVATIKSENFVKAPVLDAGQLIQGKVAGLSISAPSGDPTSGSQILLRGSTTLFGANSDPLILVDGVPSSLKTVAPEDIESIDVLKDGSAAAIYGVRGTNGVIIITTKRASGNFNSSVEYSGSVSTQSAIRSPQMLTAADYRDQIASGIRDKSYDLGSSVDWLKEISNSTPITNVHNLTFRGGNSKTNYLATVNYRSLNGLFKKSDNQTLTARTDINHYMLDDKLKINIGLLMQQNKFTQTADGSSFNGAVYRQALIRNPTSPLLDPTNGHYFEEPNNFEYDNPMGRLYESDGRNQNTTQRLSTQLTYTPFDGLKFNALGSYSRYNMNSGYSETKFHISNIRDKRNGYAGIGSNQSIDRLMEFTAQYDKTLGDHRLSVLGGYSYQENETLSFFERNYDFPTDIFSYYNIGLGRAAGRGLGTLNSNYFTTNLVSFFSRVTYNYKDRYLLLASLRREGASQLYGAKAPFGNFPAVQVGWRITQEKFMSGQKVFDDLKLRAGYGVTGNQPSLGFGAVALLGYGNFVLSNGQWIQILVPSQNPNPDLRWEEKHETDIGLDFSMMKGFITGTVDLYDRRIKGLLYDYQVPSPPNLYNTTRANVGTMQNKGVEVLLNIAAIRRKDFEWTTSFNFSTNANKLISLSNDLYQATTDYFTTGSTGPPATTFTNIVRVGTKIGDFYGFKVKGVSSDGRWIYEGADGQDVPYDQFNHSFEEKKVLGNGVPKYYAGWNNNIRYKNWDLAVTMRGAFGYQILNFQRMYYENTSVQNYNRLKSAYDPVFGTAVLNKNMPVELNSYYIENGSFWKIDNITLGYSFNNLKSKFIHNPRVYASTLNTFMITGYKGVDPEVERGTLSPGNDNRDKYPTARTFTVGFSTNF